MQKELSLLFCCWLMVVLHSCSSPTKQRKAEVTPLSVKTMVIGAQEDAVAYTRYVGTVEAIQETPLSLQSAGRVTEVMVQEGSAVSRGQVILRIDNTQAVNALRSTEATLHQAKDGYNRAQQVYAKGAITDQQMVEITSKRTQAQALYDAAKRQVEECELKAPCDGVVSGLDTRIGQTIVPGVPLLQLLDLSAYAVRFTVPENEIGGLTIGQKGLVECTTMDTVLACAITDKGLQANPLAHTYDVKARIQGGQPILRPGMVCKVRMTNEALTGPMTNDQSAIIIPAKCILLKPEGPTVWLKVNGVAVRRSVTIGGYQAEGVLITAGLQAGDTLITEGYQKLYMGCKVIDN
ncbi:MAG: efflux RND transporter periplasmic adaptor subunit [Paludibacteraceae bacterium]|nr:efflux RND transporter periplasmic adaptor subunit [Paludibacteraceae bacterium]